VFKAANPGLALDYQFIDVPDFKGKGESEPAPYYYQNLGEAEWVPLVLAGGEACPAAVLCTSLVRQGVTSTRQPSKQLTTPAATVQSVPASRNLP
jgi:hypothetical protein